MIVDERIVTYLHSLEKTNSPILERIEKEALDTFVPIIRKELESFLRVELAILQPQKVLEVGTAVGYSALLMSECLPENGTITTIENYEKRIPIAKKNFKDAGKEDAITLLEGDAMDILPTLKSEEYDFIFMDAAKGQYIHFFPQILRVMKPGAVLISDNVLQEGELIESRYGIERRNRTIHSRMREYLYMLKNHEELITSVVPIGDGITISYKKNREDNYAKD